MQSLSQLQNDINLKRIPPDGIVNIVHWHGYIRDADHPKGLQIWAEVLIADATGYYRCWCSARALTRRQAESLFTEKVTPALVRKLQKMQDLLLLGT